MFVVATPIGNKQDISSRAIEVLNQVQLIISEAPLKSTKLLKPLGIATKVVPIFVAGKKINSEPVQKQLEAGKDVALISEAGTPGINDPGGLLVALIKNAGHEVKVVPGPNAAIAAASISGFPMDQFVYKGFVPHKKGRETFFKGLNNIESAIIFYESPHRLRKTLDSLNELMPERYLSVSRELTKVYEQTLRGPVQVIAGLPESDLPIKGEFVLVLAPKEFQDKK